MAEDSPKRKDGLVPPPLAARHPGPEDTSGEHSQKLMPGQVTRETLYQQRQKCELKRLLKHTHPELKMSDEVVDDELAEVLSSEAGMTAGETGYEGEVFSRRLLFENCASSNRASPDTPRMHMSHGQVDEGDISKKSATFEKHEQGPCHGSVKEVVQDDKRLPDPTRECEEEEIRIDFQASRRIFESQSEKTSRANSNNRSLGKASIFRGAVQTQKHEFETCSRDNPHSQNKDSACTTSFHLTDPPQKQEPRVCTVVQSTDLNSPCSEEMFSGEGTSEDDSSSLTDPGGSDEIIKTSAALFRNNPFISSNIGQEKHHVTVEDPLITNVKNRAHLFESMPFDKIKRQNKDDVETLVENIKETLNTLYLANAIHSDGSIIEVNETMIAKKTRFMLRESGPEIRYDEVAEGGAQNFIVQLLPRSNLKPQITYLKEDRTGNMDATVVSVPVHHWHSTSSQDPECKTANVVQLVEDILNQDNSLRKGVIIQEDANKCAKVMVYSLYCYFDEKDVKSYSAPGGNDANYNEPETEETHDSKKETQGLRKSIIESTISCLLDSPYTGSIRPEVTEKVNVKLFKSCIEKGDMDYLKTLQTEATEQEQELPPNQTVVEQTTQLQSDPTEESSSEWVPVDVKKLKSLFSVDQRKNQPKHTQSTAFCNANRGKSVPLGKSQNSTECALIAQEVCKFPPEPPGFYLHPDPQDDNGVHQAQLVEVLDDDDEISNLKTAIHSLQQATAEAKSLYDSSQNKQKRLSRGPEAELHQENNLDGVPSASDCTSVQKTDHQDKSIAICNENENSGHTPCEKNTNVVQNKFVDRPETQHEQQEEDEVVFQGKFQGALDSLERSNINVTRGDFKAAMIYKNSSRSHKDSSQQVYKAPVQQTENLCSQSEPRSGQVKSIQEDVVQNNCETLVDSPETKQEEDEVVFEGKLQEALDSLERSNINVTRGDFKAAMIYKNSSRTQRGNFQKVDKATVQQSENISQVDVVQHKFETLVDRPESKQEDDEVVFEGKLQEALDSLEKSNINVSRGDFRAAMIYKNSSRTHKGNFQKVDKATVQQTEDLCPQRESGSAQVESIQEDVVQKKLETKHEQQEDNEVVFEGKLQEALDSLGRSNINVSRGDFKAAMIYKNSSRTQKDRSQKVDKASFQRAITGELCPVIESRSAELSQEISEEQDQSETLNKSEQDKRPTVSKPAIPPKPQHLKKKQRDNQTSNTKEFESNQTESGMKTQTVAQSLTTSVSCKDEDVSSKRNPFNQPHQQKNPTAKVITPEEGNQAKDTMSETDESRVDFSEACQKFGGKKASLIKNAPVKPKRVKLAHADYKNPKDTLEGNKTVTDPCPDGTQTGDSKDRHKTGGQIKQGRKVEMRVKRARAETEDERRQRLSVHMDDIMRGNMTAAMEIFDNLQKQEELQNILSHVEEIEHDTSEVDVTSMRRVFENVPEWVVASNDGKQEKLGVEHREETLSDNPQSSSSMAHIFGDLERASEEILNLKEQTLAKLIDIEEAIKNALCSVSTLKSDSDIAGLSCLFKESLGTMKESPSSGNNISKISIGSSRTKPKQAQEVTALLAGPSTEVASAKQPPSPPSSPAFISIQSAVKKTDGAQPNESTVCPTCQQSPKTEGKFRTAKTVTCNSTKSTHSPVNPKRERSVLEVQNDREGNPIVGTKTVSQNYERTDYSGNRFYSSKTIVTTQPETAATTTSPTSVSAAATCQVTTYPEVRLPVNRNT